MVEFLLTLMITVLYFGQLIVSELHQLFRPYCFKHDFIPLIRDPLVGIATLGTGPVGIYCGPSNALLLRHIVITWVF